MVQKLLFTTKKSSKSNPEYSVCATDAQFHTFVVKITSHSLSLSLSSVVSASLLSLLYFSTIPSNVEVNNEYQKGLITFFDRNTCSRSFRRIDEKSSVTVHTPEHWRILLKLDLLGTSYAVVKHHYVYALDVVTGYLVCFEFVFCAFDLFFRDFRQIFS